MAKLVVYAGLLDEYGVSANGFVTIDERAEYILCLQFVVDVEAKTVWACFSATDEHLDETLDALRARTTSSSDIVYANKKLARLLNKQLPDKSYQYLSPGPGNLSAAPFLARFRAKLKPLIYSCFWGLFGKESDAFGTLAEWNHFFQENASWFVFQDAEDEHFNLEQNMNTQLKAWRSFSGTLHTLGKVPDSSASDIEDERESSWLGTRVPSELLDGDIRVEFALNSWQLDETTLKRLECIPWAAVRKQFEQAKSRLDAILKMAPEGQPYSTGESAISVALQLVDPLTIWHALDALETYDVKREVGWDLREFHKFTQLPRVPANPHVDKLLIRAQPHSSLSEWHIAQFLRQIYPSPAHHMLDFSQLVFMHRVWKLFEYLDDPSFQRAVWCAFFDESELMLAEVLAWAQRNTALPERYGRPDSRLGEMAKKMWNRLADARFVAQSKEGEFGWVRVDEALAWLKDIDPELLSDDTAGSITPALVLQICAQSPARVQFKKTQDARWGDSSRRTELLVSQVVCQRKYAVALCRAGLSLDGWAPWTSVDYREKKALVAETGPLERGPWFCLRNT